MPTIAEFLTARLDEDQATAEAAADRDSGEWFMGRKWNVYRAEDVSPEDDEETNELVVYGNVKSQSEHIARYDPARVLAEVAAKRALLKRLEEDADRCTDDAEWRGASFALDKVLEYLAAPYADHPDYDPTWSVDAPH